LNVKFDRIDELVGAVGANEEDQGKRPSRDKTAVESELDVLCGSIRADLAAWCDEPAAKDNVKEKAERIGMSGASEKRIAIAYMLGDKVEASRKAYEKSRDLYRAALELEPFNHWVITQYLSMNATPILAHASDALKGLTRLRLRPTRCMSWDRPVLHNRRRGSGRR